MLQSGENPANVDLFIEQTNLRAEVDVIREIYSEEALKVSFHGNQNICNIIAGLAGFSSKYVVSEFKVFAKFQRKSLPYNHKIF